MDACRICLSKANTLDMKTEVIQDRSLYSVFLEFCGLEVSETQMAMICFKCKDFLSSFRAMKRKVLTNSVYFLNNLVKVEKNCPEVIENPLHTDDLEVEEVEDKYFENSQPVCEITLTKQDEHDDDEYVEYLDEALLDDDQEDPEETNQPSPVKKPIVIKAANANKSNDHWCAYCFQRFPTRTSFVRHRNEELAANGGMKCDLCNYQNVRRQRFVGHMRRTHLIDRSLRFACDICGTTFSQKGQIIGHKRVAHFNFRYICHLCSKPLTSKSRLNMHIKHYHEKQRNVICPDCGKGLATKSQLKVHKIQMHTDLKPYSCSYCDKTFSSQSGKIVHESKILIHNFMEELLLNLFLIPEIHKNERFQCEQCDYVTNTVCNLKRHMIRHQDVYKYTCATCGQQFKCSSSLAVHQYTHQENNFECEYCKKKFSRPQNLKIHIDAVHLQKRHTCPTCNEEFSSLNCVKKHIKIQHDGIRYFCQCGKYFDRRTRYTKHGEDCHLAATNEPEIKSIYSEHVVKAAPGRPAKYRNQIHPSQE